MENNKYNTSNGIVYLCRYHVIWCVKYRRKILTGEIKTRLKELIKEACVQIGIDKIKLDIFQEHVSIVIEVDPQYGIHKAIKTIKSITSRILREEFVELKTKLPTLWSNSYFVSTEANVSEEIIQAYIKSQATSQRNETLTRKKRNIELKEETREVE